MDTPQLSRIDSHARVSAAARPDEAKAANGSRGFAALLIGEDAAGRRRRRFDQDSVFQDSVFQDSVDQDSVDQDDEPAPREDAAPNTSGEPATETVIEAESASDGEDILPEDAHDPQELRALLAVPPPG